MNARLTQRQEAALALFLEALYSRLKAEKVLHLATDTFSASPNAAALASVGRVGKALMQRKDDYDKALRQLKAKGVTLNDHVLWGTVSIDVLYKGAGKLFLYEGVYLEDERGIGLLVYTGNIATDYREALLRCFGDVLPGASCYTAAVHSGMLFHENAPVLGELLAYRPGNSPADHEGRPARSRK